MSFFVVAILAAGAFLAAATLTASRLLERRHPPSGRFVEVTGGFLHAVDLASPQPHGAGPPIVLIHGASGSLADMRIALGERLAGAHRVILIDRPGHGWSDRGGGAGPEPARQAMRVAEALERLGVAPAVVVGHSWAGALALALALDHRKSIAGLVLLAPVTHPWRGSVSWYYRVAAVPVMGDILVRTLVMPIGAMLLRPGVAHVFAPQPAPVDYVARAAIALHLRPAEFLANARDVTGLKAAVAAQAPRYGEINVPVTIITGDSDRTVSASIHSRALARTLPHARLIVLPGIGHMPHHVAAEIVVAEIERMAKGSRSLGSPA